MKFLLFYLFCLLNISAWAQNYTLKGTLRNTENQPLTKASVYVSNYKIGTVTDAEGHFAIPNMPQGVYTLMFQSVGYRPTSAEVQLDKNTAPLNLQMQENITELKEVMVAQKMPKDLRKRYLQIFINQFIGESPNAKKCKLLNPEVLDINYSASDKKLTVTASDVLNITNKELGYTIKYLLKEFECDFEAQVCSYLGLPSYEEISAKSGSDAQYLRRRAKAYQGSQLHFFRSLIAGSPEKEGFQVYAFYQSPNPERKADSLIRAQLKALTEDPELRASPSKVEAYHYWYHQKIMPEYLEALSPNPLKISEYSYQDNQGNRLLKNTTPLYVIYTKGQISPSYSTFDDSLRELLPKSTKDKKVQLSLLERHADDVYILPNGNTNQPKALLSRGYWGWLKLGDNLPLNY